jgi:hypothetical protein
MKKKTAFQPTEPQPRESRAVTIELRGGRRLTGVLNLPKRATTETLLGTASPFLTIRTSRGDLAINREEIVAILLEEPRPAPEEALRRQARMDVREEALRVMRERRRRGFTSSSRAPLSAHQGVDPCRVLKVRPGASQEELRSAWRQRIREIHPDKLRSEGRPDDVVAAAEREAAIVNSAYQTLVAQKRSL